MLSRASVRAGRALAAQSTSSVVPRAFVASSARTYATAASSDGKPPVALYGLDGTYASALFTAAAKTSTLDSTAKAMSTLEAIFASDKKLTSMISSPTLSGTDKSAIVAELAKQSGAEKEKTIKNFMDTLASNNRLGLLEGISQKFGVLMSAAKGEVECLVVSASPLDQKLLNRLESAVSKSEFVGKDKTLKITNKVDPSILGGLVVEIEGRTIDYSVSRKIAQMNNILTEAL